MEWFHNTGDGGGAPRAARVLLTGRETGGAFALLALTLAPFSPGAPPHRHQAHSEACYVLAGTLAITRGDDTVVLSAGESLLVRPGVVHTCWNPTASGATLLLIYTPGGPEDEVRALASLSAGAPAAG
jgi:quercetin dioxygenase-like cupin family protein